MIAGKAKGRRLKSPTTGTRPMTDRMKESLFSSLGDCDGLAILDLFAGSGSLGIEALSRGAERAVFVESARDAVMRLEQNIEVTELAGQAEVMWTDVNHILDQRSIGRVDLIFVDPPYSTPAASVRGVLEELVMGGYLADDGRIVVHRPTKEKPVEPLGLELQWHREYGQSQVFVYSHEQEDG